MGIRKLIVVPTIYIDEELADFPLILKVSADTDIGAVCESDGSDVVLHDSNNDVIPFKRDSFSVTGGAATGLWIAKRTCTYPNPDYFYLRAGFGDTDQQSPTAVWGSSCKARWSLNEASGTCYDSTSNGHNLSPTDSPTYGIAGIVGNCVGTNGGYFSTGDHADFVLGSNNFTICFLMKATSWGNWWEHYWLAQDEGGGAYAKCIFSYSYSSKVLVFHYRNGSGSVSQELHSSSISIATGAWKHIGITRNGNTFTFYVNGEPQGTAVASDAIPDVAAPFYVCWGEAPGTFDGYIDDILFYNGEAKSSAWMKWKYNNSVLANSGLAMITAPTASGGGSLIDGGLIS